MDIKSNGQKNDGCIIVDLKPNKKLERQRSSFASNDSQKKSAQDDKRRSRRERGERHRSSVPELNLTGLSDEVASAKVENLLKRHTDTEQSCVSILMPRHSGKDNANEVERAILSLLERKGYYWEFAWDIDGKILVYLASSPSTAG